MSRSWRSLRPLCCLLILAASFSACDSIQELKNKFLGDSDAVEASKPNPRKAKKAAEPENPSPTPDPAPPDANGQVAVEPPASPPPNGSAPAQPQPGEASPPAEPVPPAPNAAQPAPAGAADPITPVDQFAGALTSLDFAAGHLYAGFGRKLTAYDAVLKAKAGILLESGAERIVAKQESDARTLYVREANGILEIVRFPESGEPSILKSFKVDGPFDIFIIPNAFTPAVQPPADAPAAAPIQSQDALGVTYLPNRVQMLNLNNPGSISVVGDIPVTSVTHAYPAGNYLYLAKDTSLEIADRFTTEIRASIPIGTRFRILKITEEKAQKQLLLALQSPKTGKWVSFQWLPLGGADLRVKGLGTGVELASGADELLLDPQAPLVYLKRDSGISVFDLTRKKEWASPRELLSRATRMAGGQNALYLASETAIARYDFQLPAGESAAAPVGSPPPSPEPFAISQEQTLPLASNVEILHLLSGGAVLLANAPPADSKAPPLFASKNIALEGASLTPIWFPNNETGRVVSLVPAGSAVLAQDESGRVFSVNKNLQSASAMALPAKSIIALAGDPTGSALYATGIPKPETATATEEAAGITLYRLAPNGSAKREFHLALNPEVGGLKVYGQGKFALVACGAEGVCQVDLAPPTGAKGAAKPAMTLTAKIASGRPGGKALEILVSPTETLAYAYYESPSESFISLLDLKAVPPKEIGVIPAVASKKEQFRAASFSMGGQKFLLPQDDGLLIVDLKNPRSPAIGYKWPVGKALSADVTNQGRKVCAALGPGGVACGTLR